MAKHRKLKQPPSYRRRIHPVPVYLAVALVLILVFVVLSLTVLFPLENYAVSGLTPYTEEEIIAAAGLAGKENLLRLDTDKIERRILARLPYLETVEVKADLPTTLMITCTEAEAYASYTENGTCYLVDRRGRVLAETKGTSDLILLSGIKAPAHTLAEDAKENRRTYLTFDSDRTREALASLADYLDGISFGRVTRINLPSYLDLSFVIDDRVRVKIGTVVDMEYKMTFTRRIFGKEDAVPAEGYAIVDVSNTSRGASVKTNVNNDLTEADILG